MTPDPVKGIRENSAGADKGMRDGYTHAEDLAQKTAVQYFGEEVTKWLGIEEKVLSVAPTEKVTMEVRHLYEDFNFIMQSGTWYHFEFESDRLTKKDLRRFREYEATTSAAYGVEVITCVVSSWKKQRKFTQMKTGINKYRIRLILLKDFSADEVMNSIRENGEIRKQDLIPVALCPLLGGEMPMKERIMEGFRILKRKYAQITEPDARRLQAIPYVLAQKFLRENEMKEVKEAVNMTYLGQLIFDDGVNAGIEKGIEKGIEILIRVYREFGLSRSSTGEKIAEDFALENAKAETYLERFWDNGAQAEKGIA